MKLIPSLEIVVFLNPSRNVFILLLGEKPLGPFLTGGVPDLHIQIIEREPWCQFLSKSTLYKVMKYMFSFIPRLCFGYSLLPLFKENLLS